MNSNWISEKIIEIKYFKTNVLNTELLEKYSKITSNCGIRLIFVKLMYNKIVQLLEL